MENLIAEIAKADVGYLITHPRIVESILSIREPSFFQEIKTRMWIPRGERVDEELVRIFSELAIPIRSAYGAGEVGPIGFECAVHSGYYHVTTSNVLVEIVDQRHKVDGATLGKILVTHLHSYATPFIRYDLDDLGALADKCPCGHDGPAIHALQGRVSGIVKHADGRITPFNIRAKEISPLAQFDEFRLRQTTLDKLVLDLGGRSELSTDEIAAVTALLKNRAGEEFQVEIRPCQTIDWGESLKRPSFRCEVR
jgi:phenylacetate-coenzyme A ligase PaaK-like adenylate-forming protein